MNSAERGRIKPFLRWAGGKQHQVNHLISYLPEDFNCNGNTYFEPFLGAGSLFLATQPKKAVLSDMNAHLIHCFRTIRDHPRELHRQSKRHEKASSSEYYYRVRNTFNRHIDSRDIAQAARFLYLNRTCFNGIFRVNTDGFFNVPWGDKRNVLIPCLETLHKISGILKRVRLAAESYERILERARKGDFVYLDPPYPPINGTSYFTHYTKERFSLEDQEKVASFAEQLSDMSCRVMVSNADLPGIRKLYKGWNLEKVAVTRYVSCKSKKYRVGELVITNYAIKCHE